MTGPAGRWEERWHPLRREWVIIAAHRDTRPWQGERVEGADRSLPRHADDCYLCPGNVRVSGEHNPSYAGVFVFDNDHPCVGPDAPRTVAPAPAFYTNRPATGVARVVCYTPRHDLTLAELPERQIVDLLGAFAAQYRELAARPEVAHVLMFENKGEVVGVSNPHPHAQIYATNFVFETVEREARAFAEEVAGGGTPLFRRIIDAEREDGRRILVDRGEALAFIPYFARYPFETYVATERMYGSVAEVSDADLQALAGVLKETLVRLDNVWGMSMPYVMVLHQRPTDGESYPGFHFYIQIIPPLRRPGLLKYLAGPEIGGGNFLNDAAPEERAAQLRATSAIHHAAIDD